MFFPHLVGACDDWIHRGISSKIGAIFVLVPECLSCACFKYVNHSIGFSIVQLGLGCLLSITQLVLVLSSWGWAAFYKMGKDVVMIKGWGIGDPRKWRRERRDLT